MADHKDAAAANRGGVVNVIVPRSDLATLNRATAQVLGKLGCGQCHSGFDIRFNQERIFILNASGEISEGF